MGEIKISKTLKELRIQKGMTQAQFSRLLNIARQTYSAYERGARCPDLEMASRTAKLLHVSLDWLVFDEKKEEADPFASLPEDAKQLCRAFYALSPEKQQEALDFIEFLEQRSRTES